MADSVQALRDLLTRTRAAHEEERHRIAGRLHDEPLQHLAAVDLRLGLLRRALADRAPDLLPDLARVQESIVDVSRHLRELLVEIEPLGPKH